MSKPTPVKTSLSGSVGDSSEQREAERYLVRGLAEHLGIDLRPAPLVLRDGSRVEIDGINEAHHVYCEAYARLGKLKPGNRRKLASDILKLIVIRMCHDEEARIFIIVADDPAEVELSGKSWLASALRAGRIAFIKVELPDPIRLRVEKAQIRQHR